LTSSVWLLSNVFYYFPFVTHVHITVFLILPTFLVQLMWQKLFFVAIMALGESICMCLKQRVYSIGLYVTSIDQWTLSHFVKIWCDMSWQEGMDRIQLQDLNKLFSTQNILRVF
jgi:hypothetical protein